MRLVHLAVHNFRSLRDAAFHLGPYSLLVGANNAGKSNVLACLRVFYDKAKYTHDDDFPKFPTDDRESWIEATFALSTDEFGSLPEKYRQPGERLRVRKYLEAEKGKDGKPRSGIVFGYVGESLDDEPFHGAKNVQQGKLGDVIFIPAVSRLDEHTKTSGPSALRDLLGDIVKKLVRTSASFSALSTKFREFTTTFKGEKTDEGRSLGGLEAEINKEIGEWGTRFELSIDAPTDEDLVKGMVSHQIVEHVLKEPLDASQLGHGFQRQLIYTLLLIAARYQPRPAKSEKKVFQPDLSLLLFEEPEAYLHPPQQELLARGLRALGNQDGRQVLISTHAPLFVSLNCDDIPSIVRLGREGPETRAGQVEPGQLPTLFKSNFEVNEAVRGTKCEAEADDYLEQMEAIKHFLWLGPDRAALFFARHVLLVEGPSERALIGCLVDAGAIKVPAGGMFVLDTLGKYNQHRFMNLLGPLRIGHSVLLDDDDGKPPHPKVLELLEASRNPYTRGIATVSGDLERFLGIPPAKSPHRKPQHVLLHYKDGRIKPDRIEALCALVSNLVSAPDAAAPRPA